MQKIAISLLIIVFLSILGCSKSDSPDHTNGKLIIGLSAEYPPFEFYDKGKLTGFDVELMQAIGEELGIEIKFKEMAFHSLIPSLELNHIDAAISSITITPQRQQTIDFSNQYYQNHLAVVYLKSTQSPSVDFSHKKVGVQLGSTMETWIKSQSHNMSKMQIIALDSNPPLIEKLKISQVDYVIVEKLQAIKFCEANPTLTYSLIGAVSDGYGIAFKKNSIHTAQINQALQSLEDNGVLAKLKEKWFGD